MAFWGEVFGLTTSVPVLTYVDRAGLDERFSYYPRRDRHIVIYGASKQGKTNPWKKDLPEEQCLIVRCTGRSTLEIMYQEVLRLLGAEVPTHIRETLSLGSGVGAQAGGKAGVPFVAKVSGGRNASCQLVSGSCTFGESEPASPM
jgi:hypothetical protein